MDNKFILFAINGSQALVILTLRELGGISTFNEIATTCKLSRATVKTAMASLESYEIVIQTKGFETFALSNRGREFLGMSQDFYVEELEDEQNPGFVYFIDNGNYIKIGYSVDPYQRMADLQSATEKELVLLAVVSGSKKDERELHKRFENNKVRGEWFSRIPELDAMITEHSLDVGKKIFSRNSNKESILVESIKDNAINMEKNVSIEFLKQQGVWENQVNQIASYANNDINVLKSQFNGDDLKLILWRIKNNVPPPAPIETKYAICIDCNVYPCECVNE